MSSSKNVVVAFDAYGTLLSTESIAKQLAEHFGQDKAQTIAATWRKYQLEYTWRLNSMAQYIPFSDVTQRSLVHALSESSVSLSSKDIDSLMRAYDSLRTFPDVTPGLKALAQTPDLTAVVFSNGTIQMINKSVHESPDLSPHASVFRDIVVVEEVKKYKPAPEVYHHLAKTVGKQGNMADIWLVSGNPFDVCGAKAVGMHAVWVDRAGNGWQDQLVGGDAGRPDAIVKGLEEVVNVVKESLSV